MDVETKRRIDDLEDALIRVTMQYQSEVGEPRRMLMQAGEWMKQFDWRSISEPPELAEVLALVNAAVDKVSSQRQSDLGTQPE
jgi:hypothetical protein